MTTRIIVVNTGTNIDALVRVTVEDATLGLAHLPSCDLISSQSSREYTLYKGNRLIVEEGAHIHSTGLTGAPVNQLYVQGDNDGA